MVSFGTFLPKPCLSAVRWQNSCFSRLLGDDISDILVPGWGWVFWWCLLAFILLPLRFSYLPGRPSWMCLFDTAHFEFLIEIFKNFCNADCRTLHPPRAVVCRPRQTREDVHILVATIQWSSDTVATWYFRNLNRSRCPKTRYCPKTCVFASLAGFLRFHTNNGFLHWKNISNFRHLALSSKQFQTFYFAPKFQNF